MDINSLHNKFLQCKSISTDTRSLEKGSMFFALSGPNFNGNKFAKEAINKGARYAVVDDESYLEDTSHFVFVENTLHALQDLATHHREKLNCNVFALTGSNGKTTTKELINRVLSKKYITHSTLGNYNNHIGVPITLLQATHGIEFLVVEMGANHQGEINQLCNIAKPDFGLITNIGKAHLEGFGGLEGVRKGKSELYRFLNDHQGLIFVNTDNDELKVLVSPFKNVYAYDLQDLSILESVDHLHFLYEGVEYKSALTGLHNLENLINAIQIGKYFNVFSNDIVEAIHSYIPTNNRSESVRIGSIEIFKDAYNANPTSLLTSLDSFLKRMANDENFQIILGDMLELGEYSDKEHFEVLQFLYNKGVINVIAIGPEFSKHFDKFPYEFYSDVNQYMESINIQHLLNNHLFLKGSRGLRLERIVDKIADLVNNG